ncbi:hypothetical protein BAL199_01074 [alpha proteobacterium BAL199]|jgi:CBS domain-containing protein|nr:hypothetical protein BAL199_01074 [alpha proteobacterium BAL199]
MTKSNTPLPGTAQPKAEPPTVGENLSSSADVVLHPDHTVDEALLRLREKGRFFAPVVDGDAIVGVVTESRLAADCGDDSQEIAVRDCMRATVPFLYADDALSLAASIAAQTEIDQFCVVNHDHLLLGILSVPKTATGVPAAPRRVDPQVIRRRLAVTPGRAASADPGTLGTYAEGPTLYVDGRAAREPEDRPIVSLRRRRHQAMRTKL